MNLDMSLKPLDDLANDIIEKVTDTGVKMVRPFLGSFPPCAYREMNPVPLFFYRLN